MLTSRY